ncbi:peroxidase family protein [Sphingomonas bacterium]|uniref:peroxidase family protein n=1 Tax=Sphingomonas bacterium TaxID=1895847 RepID=UPI001576F1B7|nr:peroxidase family protein [Sphingomonas bacterium]
MPTIIKAPGHGGQTRGLTAGSMPGMAAGTNGGMMPGAGVGRFGRMFDDAVDRPRHSDALLLDLAHLMTGTGDPNDPDIDRGKPIRTDTTTNPPTNANDEGDENPVVPAGYTYFGQFVDHDITFDPTPLHGKEVDPNALADYRTPALDLDSVYGSGPDNQPYLYTTDQNGFTILRTGADISGGIANAGAATASKHDHFRLPPDADGLAMAVLGDKRNDENKLVAQIHTAFVALHNKLMGDPQTLLKMGAFDVGDPEARFRMAVKTVRWHYQWVVLFDYARDRLCELTMVDEVLNAGSTPRLSHYLANSPPFAYMPVEFSVAAFRLGHSMVRPTYALNETVGSTPPFDKLRIPIFKVGGKAFEALNGFGQAIPAKWGIDWSFFLDGPAKPVHQPGTQPLAIPQLSYRMDATIVDPLAALPEFKGKQPDANLAFRNLLRGRMLLLPSGEAVAGRLGIKPLTFEELWWSGSQRDPARDLAKVDDDRKTLATRRKKFGDDNHAAIAGATPLWYYILREAELFGTMRAPNDPFGGQHLGPVGSRIVAETFVGLLWMDQTSFLHSQTPFRPVLGLPKPLPASERFTLADLIRYALS